MTDRQLSLAQGNEAERRQVTDAADYRITLRDRFGLDLGEDEIARLPLFAAGTGA